MTSTRVLFVSHSGVLAGSERCLVDLIRVLDRASVEPAVLAPRNGPLVVELEALGIPVSIIPFDRWLARRNGWPQFAARAARTTAMLPALVKSARRFGPDVIYTNSAVVPIGAVLARLLGVPHVWHVRELVRDDPSLNTPLGRQRVLRLIEARSDAIIAVSDAIRAQFSASGREAVQVIWDGLDVAALRSVTAANDVFRTGAWPKLLAVAALIPQKGIVDLLALADELLPRWPKLELAIVGDGPNRTEFERMRSHLGLDDVVTFRGYLPDAPAVMRAATLTLSASHIESFGRVVLESVAVGTPVIATDTGASRLILGEGAGVVVQTRAPHEMAAAVDRVLSDAHSIEVMRRATAAAARRFEVGLVAAQVEDVVRRVRVVK